MAGRKQLDVDDICPVCKSSRYLNPKMRFMIEPSCYHKMCESCVDRIFSQGPAPCPVAGCAKTLRKARFKTPKFEDLAIEREVDIRATVARTLNRREEDFETLRDFNDYEETKEDIIWNLVKGIDVEKTQAQLRSYAAENKQSIRKNAALEEAEAAAIEEAEKLRLERSALAREAAITEREAEKAEREAGRKQIISKLAHSSPADAARIASEGERAVRKQSSMRRVAQERLRDAQLAAETDRAISLAAGGGDENQKPKSAAAAMAEGLGFRGLKKTPLVEADKPYSPFGGIHIRPRYYALQDAYDHAWSDKARLEPVITAGGYDVREYYARAQVDAHAGLGIFLATELAAAAAAAPDNREDRMSISAA